MALRADQSSGLQNVEDRRTLGSAASGHLVEAPLVRARAATGAFGDAEDDTDAGAIELVAQDSVPASGYRLLASASKSSAARYTSSRSCSKNASGLFFTTTHRPPPAKRCSREFATPTRPMKTFRPAPSARGRYRGRGRGSLSDPTPGNK